ncbi:galactose-1-phosphate uridylyltransferase [Candidatus Bathyarchaeota archaeon CG07_land_8_20_14_0_80_47_9]|nr:MAG: galactose-1-phosphate uridylyltransferase [Candidatus Bathyarchaeota archaeon CG07_land_8_20_14_0_80_47_9]
MGFNEVRKDYLLDRWVVIATERGRRPTDFANKEREKAKTGVCLMCPGNEHMTPPAVLVYLKHGNGIRKTEDKDDTRHKNWAVRVIPNLFPAFAPPKNKTSQRKTAKCSEMIPAVGHHEVLVESPNHDEHPADARLSQLEYVVDAYVDRLRELSARPYVKYVSIFRNHGLEAGASLSHAHSQIIATPSIPKTVEDELEASKRFWKQNKKCVFCEIIKKERGGPRLILENSKFVVFAPYASVNPMEFWIIPKKHEATLLDLSKSDVKALAETLKACLGGLKKLVNDPPYNYGFHLAIDKDASDYYHWHLEVYPKLAIWAGFEKSTGMYINTVTPEAAAEHLRKTISS